MQKRKVVTVFTIGQDNELIFLTISLVCSSTGMGVSVTEK